MSNSFAYVTATCMARNALALSRIKRESGSLGDAAYWQKQAAASRRTAKRLHKLLRDER